MEYQYQLEHQIRDSIPNSPLETTEVSSTNPNEIVMIVKPQAIRELARLLKAQKGYRWLMDICGVHYPEREKSLEVVYHFFNRDQNRRIRVKVPHKEGEKIPSLVSVYKAANWFEREAFDMFGIIFEGHPNLTRILCHHEFVGHPLRKDYHPRANQTLSKPIEYEFEKSSDSDDEDILLNQKNYLNLGPSHPATHGTFRWFVELEGETIVRSRAEIGYLHRCFEKMAETHKYNQVIPYTDRLNYLSAPMNNDGYCRTVEKLLGVEIPARGRYIRVILNELSRIIDHLVCIGTTSVDMGALSTFWYCFSEREETYTLFEKLCGNRMLTSVTRVGGIAGDIDEDWMASCRARVKSMRNTIDEIDALLSNNKIWLSRMKDTGVISREDAIDFGFTGPCLRATGEDMDLRKQEPYYFYDTFDFEVPTMTGGDNYSRYMIRILEMRQSCRIIEQALSKLPSGPTQIDDPKIVLPPKKEIYSNIEALMNHFMLIIDGVKPPAGDVYSYTEAANGELGFYLVSDGSGKPYRLKVRPPCFPIYSAFEDMIQGGMVADAVATLGQLNVIAGELDR
ncbi:MAG: NADH-quinone oxidoreductase subunit C [Deltaproteobacteria bacterium CG11_big_fil_rev_8_21_14_0_20_45_16]|nr:MAG: NADH-quinone oxidoreductase subunit C [Deltaproteobacteria bacterium CG11_big_fil_rev_8_21_14_0_20_45_16]